MALDRDTVGPLARTVLDTAAILNFIAGRDENDPAINKIPFEEIPDYTDSCTTSGFSEIRLGIPRNALEEVPVHILTHFNDTVRRLQELGAQSFDVEFPAASEYRNLTSREKILPMATEFRPSIARYLGSLEQNPKNLRTLEDIYRLTKSDPHEDFPNRDLELWEMALTTSRDSDEYKAAKNREEDFAGSRGILGAIEAHELDAIIAPCAARIINHFAAGGGLPMISVPLGYLPDGTPVEWSERHDTITQAPNRP